MGAFVLFTVFFVFCSVCFIFPPPEFVALGLTVESMFSSFLGNESHSFIHYHIKRSVATLLTHSSIPLVYVAIASYMFPEWTFEGNEFTWKIIVAASLVPPTISACIASSWKRANWRNHPIADKLKKFVTQGSSLNQITSDIDNECRSVNKIIIKCNALTRVIATDNWLIKVSPYDMCIAHQSDVTLKVTSTSQFQYIPGRIGSGQFLNIDVESSRPNVPTFQIRINSTDFKDLQDRVTRPINILENVVVYKSLTDHFIDTFKKCVQDNPKITVNENLDVCIACMQATPDVKLSTSCGDVTGPQKCTMCYCRPMWCVDCMAKWFASRQDQERPGTWLSSKCTCPMCRNTFCILDVCPVVTSSNSET